MSTIPDGHSLLPIRPLLQPPPCLEILRSNIDPQLFQRLGAQVAVIRPLCLGVRIIALRVGLHPIERQPHDLREELADLVLGVAVFGGELQDGRQTTFILGFKVLGRDVYRGEHAGVSSWQKGVHCETRSYLDRPSRHPQYS